MKVREIMSPNVYFVHSDDTIQTAAKKMKDLNVGDLPVVIDQEAVGFITDRDIAIRATAHGLDPKASRVIDAMTEGVIACEAEDAVESAAELMGSRQIRRLPVKDEDGKLCGIVSLGDVAAAVDKPLVGDILRKISS